MPKWSIYKCLHPPRPVPLIALCCPLCVTGASQERARGSWGVVWDNQGILATCSWAPKQGCAGITWPVYSAGSGERGCVQGLINHGRFGRDKQQDPAGVLMLQVNQSGGLSSPQGETSEHLLKNGAGQLCENLLSYFRPYIYIYIMFSELFCNTNPLYQHKYIKSFKYLNLF